MHSCVVISFYVAITVATTRPESSAEQKRCGVKRVNSFFTPASYLLLSD